MSALAKNFDKISSVYRDIAKNVYDPAVNLAFEQIQSVPQCSQTNNILDIGCGDGSTLHKINKLYPKASLTGADISKNMLERARQQFNINTIQSDVSNLQHHVSPHAFNLILSHFVLGYVALEELLNKARLFISDDGYMSIATSAETSFSGVKSIVQNSCSSIRPLKKFIDYKIRQGMEKSKNRIDWSQISTTVQAYGFEVVAFETLTVECEFSDARQLFDYIFYGSWGVGELKPYIPMSVYRFCYSVFLNRLTSFPFKDHAEVQVALLKAV